MKALNFRLKKLGAGKTKLFKLNLTAKQVEYLKELGLNITQNTNYMGGLIGNQYCVVVGTMYMPVDRDKFFA